MTQQKRKPISFDLNWKEKTEKEGEGREPGWLAFCFSCGWRLRILFDIVVLLLFFIFLIFYF